MKYLLYIILLFGFSAQAQLAEVYGFHETEIYLYDKPTINGQNVGNIPAFRKFPIIKEYKQQPGIRVTDYLMIVYNGKISYVRSSTVLLSNMAKDYFAINDSLSVDSALTIEKVFRDRERLEAIKILENRSKVGLHIDDWSWTESYGSIEVHLSITNYDPKRTIKYIYITISAYNPVDDKVGSNKSITIVGPVKPYSSGSASFENVFYSKVIETLKIVHVKVLYMDGSIRLYDTPAKIKSLQ